MLRKTGISFKPYKIVGGPKSSINVLVIVTLFFSVIALFILAILPQRIDVAAGQWENNRLLKLKNMWKQSTSQHNIKGKFDRLRNSLRLSPEATIDATIKSTSEPISAHRRKLTGTDVGVLKAKVTSSGKGESEKKVTMAAPIVSVVCFQRNEDDILEFWFEYYSKIFGEQSLLMIDNNSDKKSVINILDKWEQQGVTVVRGVGPYLRKSSIILLTVRMYRPDSHIILYSDIDEFITTFVNVDQPHGSQRDFSRELNSIQQMRIPVPSKETVLDHLMIFYHSPYSALKMLPSYTSVSKSINDSAESISFFQVNYYRPSHCKILYKLNDITRMDHGNHYPHIKPNRLVTKTDYMGFLHYHNRKPIRTVERALINAIELKQLPKNTTLENVHTHKNALEILSSNNTTQGYKKLKELVQYIHYGVSSFIHSSDISSSNDPITIVEMPTLDQIISAL